MDPDDYEFQQRLAEGWIFRPSLDLDDPEESDDEEHEDDHPNECLAE